MQLKTLVDCHQLLFFIVFFLSSSAQEEETVRRSDFPDGFLFGTATSSYQIEGAYREDGKGPNNWDLFSHVPGNIKNNDTGDIADNHYYLFMEDIELMKSIGVNAYRFSLSWSRILPRGRFGKVNPRGIMFYNKLIDALLSKGIEPFVTLLHHEIPQELQDRYGAWLSPLIQDDFVHYAKICFTYFGDRVKYWTTINEPNLFLDMAFIRGWYPPARCSPPFGNCSGGDSDVEALIGMHNVLLAHAKAAKLYRHQFQPKQRGSIGIVINAGMYEAFSDSEVDREAQNRALAFEVAWVIDPLVYGDYPQEMRHLLGNSLPIFSQNEVSNYMKGSLDFIGINHYSTIYAKDCIYSPCDPGYNRAIRGFVFTTGERDGVFIGERMGNPRFFVVPRGIELMVNYLKNRYNNMPIFVTENGYAPPQQYEQAEELQDHKRVEYLKSYLASLAKAIRNGANVKGYFIWSLMDNFEWTEGYNMRYGVYYIDYNTLDRIPKLSAKWYHTFLTNDNNTSSQNLASFVNHSDITIGSDVAKLVNLW